MGKTVITDISDLESYDGKKFNPQVVFESEGIKVIAAFFREGQFIPVHEPDVTVVLYILEGEAEIVAGEKELNVSAGDDCVITVPAGEKRGVKALTDLSVLHVVQPAPSEEDHREVKEKLKAGSFK